MQKRTAEALREKALEVARQFSIKDRGANFDGETFEVERTVVLSECTAAVIFLKQPTKKRAVAWFYWINSRAAPRWEFFFVTYAHLVGLNRVGDLLHEIEQRNYEVVVDGGGRTEA